MLSSMQYPAARIAGTLVLSLLFSAGLASCGGGGSSEPGQQSTGSPSPPDGSGSPSVPEQPGSPRELPVVELKAGDQSVYAEVADEAAEREKGLMYREGLGEDDGMLFVFSQPTSICMWMQDTYIPLSVAFIDQNGVIVNIADMTPQTTELHCSHGPTRYALEMNQGWFGQRNIQPGSSITGLP